MVGLEGVSELERELAAELGLGLEVGLAVGAGLEVEGAMRVPGRKLASPMKEATEAVRGERKIWRGVPIWEMRPFSMMAMRSARWRASFWSWVT